MMPIPGRFPSIRRGTPKLPGTQERRRERQHVTMQTGSIAILSIPPGGNIYIDDVDTGVLASALITDISVGTHDIKIVLPGYEDFIDSVTVDDGIISSSFVMMTPTSPPIGTGTLDATSTPPGIEFGIYSGGTGTYTTPVSIPDIPSGINAYEGILAGYAPLMGSFIINSGMTTNLNLPLVPSTPDMGLVIMESIPMGAEIFIDDVDMGAYTSLVTMMAPGPHTYELRLSGYTPAKGNFTVVTGTDTPSIISVQLQPQSEGSGVALLAGVAVLGMMIMSKSK